jgi:predicted dehydrogenase
VAARRRRALRNLGTLDCGVHDLDLLRYLSGGEFDLIQAVGTCVEPENPYPDHLSVQGRMDNGVLFALEESGVWGHTAKERPAYFQSYRLLGEKGLMAAQVEFSHHRPVELQVVSDGIEWFEEVGSEKAWDDTYRQFFEVILGRRGGDAFIADGRDALANMRAASEIIAQCQAREASSSPA